MELPELPSTTVITAVAALLLTAIYYLIKDRNVLPGPKGVPYLGLYPYLTDSNAHLEFMKFKKMYGDMFSFTYCGRLFINLGSVKAMREVQVNNSDCFADRFTGDHILEYMLGNGVTMVNGEPWKILRKFFNQKFRERGLNTVRDNMAGPAYDSINETVDELRALQGKPINVVDILSKRCGVPMRKIVFGEEGMSDEELQKLCITYMEAFDGMNGVNMLLFGPVARLTFSISPKHKKALHKYSVMSKLLHSCVKKMEQSMNEDNPSCLIEDFYKERNDRRRNNDPTWKIFSDEALVDSALQFVGDGITAVAAFIGGFFLSLVMYPDEQEKLYAELMDVVGPTRQPVLEDRVNLPYVNAFMNEVIRESTFIYFMPSLECTKETTIRGYRIPKGSITFLNFYSAHHDPDVYEDPDTFRPSRYITDSEKQKPESPVQFGIGKRACSGEVFVMAQSFLFLTTIVKNFKVVSANPEAAKTMNFLLTGDLELIMHPRDQN